MSTKPYQDEATLRDLYYDKELSTPDIADKFDIDQATVLYWMDKHDIPRRSRIEGWRAAGGPETVREACRIEKVPYLITTGYECWRDTITGEQVAVHHLLAIADGADPHEVFRVGTVAHHRSGHRRDNRPGNIEVMDRDIHATTHAAAEWREEDGIPVLVTQRDEEA